MGKGREIQEGGDMCVCVYTHTHTHTHTYMIMTYTETNTTLQKKLSSNKSVFSKKK